MNIASAYDAIRAALSEKGRDFRPVLAALARERRDIHQQGWDEGFADASRDGEP